MHLAVCLLIKQRLLFAPKKPKCTGNIFTVNVELIEFYTTNVLFCQVNNTVSKGKAKDVGSHYVTVSKFESSLRKKLYFFPGICGDKRVHPKCI